MEQNSDIVKLNVSGTYITTRLKTLTKEPDSILAAMFSGHHVIDKDEDGRYFMDCDAQTFQSVLDYLRRGKLPSQQTAVDVYDLAVELGLQSLQQELLAFRTVQCKKRMMEMKHGQLAQQYDILKGKALEALKGNHSRGDFFLDIYTKCPSPRSSQPVFCNAQNTTYVKEPYQIQEIRERIPTVPVHLGLVPSNEMLWCLTEELHGLGFGQFIYFCSFNDLSQGIQGVSYCSNCGQQHTWQILFSSYKMVLEERLQSVCWNPR